MRTVLLVQIKPLALSAMNKTLLFSTARTNVSAQLGTTRRAISVSSAKKQWTDAFNVQTAQSALFAMRATTSRGTLGAGNAAAGQGTILSPEISTLVLSAGSPSTTVLLAPMPPTAPSATKGTPRIL